MHKAVVIVLALVALSNLVLCARGLLYGLFIYRKFLVPRFREDYAPKVAVFVPCKGMEENLESYLEAIVMQDYSDYTVTFITESVDDAAVVPIRNVVAKNPHTSHVVAGLARTCCQKNHNLLQAIARDSSSEVFIFADADIRPGRQWIRDLVLPLSAADIPISTGFRWLTPPRFTFWGTIHSMLSAYICTLMSSSSGVWGGSMAIRRKEYDHYEVGKTWSVTVVDDISLTRIIIKNRVKRVFVPHCIATSTNVLETFSGDLEWFTRQLMFLKIYCRPLWVTAFLFTFVAAGLMVLSALLLTASLWAPPLREWAPLFGIFLVMMMGSLGLIKFNYRDNQSYLVWCLLTLPGEVMGALSLVKSLLTGDLIWRNIRYAMNRDGSVREVEFLGEGRKKEQGS
ncbi:MAG: glycosyltransferase family 2 protein [Candidatus Eremiobacteraeota bacterium]|nr:glycosyltransferase family 2 protein [Candidatus Eremiobacteraeota bacterium]